MPQHYKQINSALESAKAEVSSGNNSRNSSSNLVQTMPGSDSTNGPQSSEGKGELNALSVRNGIDVNVGGGGGGGGGGGARAGGGKNRKRKAVAEAKPADRNRDAPAPVSAPLAPSASSDAGAAPLSAAAADAHLDDDFDPSRRMTKEEKLQLTPLHQLTWTLYQLLEAKKLHAMGCTNVVPILRKLNAGLKTMRQCFPSDQLAHANEVAERTLAREYKLSTSAAPCGAVRRAPSTKTVVLGSSALGQVRDYLRGAGLGYIADDYIADDMGK